MRMDSGEPIPLEMFAGDPISLRSIDQIQLEMQDFPAEREPKEAYS